MPDLDSRIRALLGAVVADAPPAPNVEPSAAYARSSSRVRSLRVKAVAAVAALVAAAGATALLRPVGDTDLDTEPDTTRTTEVAPAALPRIVMTAGPDGITEYLDGEPRRLTREPMAMALAVGNGDAVAQRDIGEGDTAPVLVTADGTITPLIGGPGATLAGPIELHDFSVVEGRRILLYSQRIFSDSPGESRETLEAFDLDTRKSTHIRDVGGWEWGSTRLHLGANGLIVGTQEDLTARSMLVAALPGSPAASRPLPKPTDYGLQEFYAGDPCECPAGYVIDAAGTTLYWIAPSGPGANTTQLMAARLDQPGVAPAKAATLPLHRDVDISLMRIDIGLLGDDDGVGVVISYVDTGDGPLHPPERVEGEAVNEGFEGDVATVGPFG